MRSVVAFHRTPATPTFAERSVWPLLHCDGATLGSVAENEWWEVTAGGVACKQPFGVVIHDNGFWTQDNGWIHWESSGIGAGTRTHLTGM